MASRIVTPKVAYVTHQPKAGAEHSYDLVRAQENIKPVLLSYIQDRDLWEIRWLFTDIKTAAYDAQVSELVKVDTTAGAVDIRLPAASAYRGMRIGVKWVDGAGALTITPNGSDLIDGATVITPAAAGDFYNLLSDGEGWLIV